MTMSTNTFYWITSICLIIITVIMLVMLIRRVRIAP